MGQLSLGVDEPCLRERGRLGGLCITDGQTLLGTEQRIQHGGGETGIGPGETQNHDVGVGNGGDRQTALQPRLEQRIRCSLAFEARSLQAAMPPKPDGIADSGDAVGRRRQAGPKQGQSAADQRGVAQDFGFIARGLAMVLAKLGGGDEQPPGGRVDRAGSGAVEIASQARSPGDKNDPPDAFAEQIERIVQHIGRGTGQNP